MILYPDNVGNRQSWSSLVIRMGAMQIPLIGAKSINYDDSLTPTKVYGTHPYAIGRTRGTYEANASVEMYLAEFEEHLKYLSRLAGAGGNGFKEVSFDIVTSYVENGMDLITDTIVGARIQSNPAANTQGADPTSRNVTLSVMKILWNGRDSVKRPLGFGL